MADKNKNINIDVTAKDKASAALKNVGKELDKIAYSSSNVNKASGSLSSSFGTLTRSLAPVGLAIGAGILLFKSLQSVMKESIALLKVQVDAEVDLQSALGFTSISLKDYASELQRVTTYGDEVIISSMAQIGAFVKDEAQIKRVEKAALDLAAAKKMDLRTATDLLTKSFVSGQNALKRYGIEMDQSESQEKRMASLLKNVSKLYEGRAEALAKTDIGKMEQLNGLLGDQKEILATQLLPVQNLWLKTQLSGWKLLNGALSNFNRNIKIALGGGYVIAKSFAIKDFIETAKESPVALGILQAELTDVTKKFEEVQLKMAKLKVTNPLNAITRGPQLTGLTNQKMALLNERRALTAAILELQNDQINKMLALKAEELAEQDKLDAEAWAKLAKSRADNDRKMRDAFLKERRAMYIEANNLQREYAENAADNITDAEALQLSIQKENISNIIDMRTAMEERLVSLKSNSLDQQLYNAETSYINETALYTKLLDEELNLNQQAKDSGYILEEEYLQKKLDLYSQFTDLTLGLEEEAQNKRMEITISKITETANKYISIAQSLMQGVQQITDLTTKEEMDNLDATTDSKKRAATATIKNRRQLEKELAKIDEEAKKRRAEIAKDEKKVAMIMSIINTAQAISGALTMMPPPVGIAMAAIVGALGAIQTGIIASQAFAQGGIVQAEHGVSTTGDQTWIRANPGEMVLNKQQQSALFGMMTNRNVYAQQPTIGGDTYIVQGNLDTNAVTEIRKLKEDWLTLLRDSNKELNYRGYRYAA